MSGEPARRPFPHAPDGVWPSVSVIVPMFNEASVIGDCIASLQRQDYPLERMEVVVVDGFSTDGSVDVVRKLASLRPHPEIKILANPKRTTPSGLNMGIGEAGGDIIVRLDAHSEAPRNYVRKNVEVLLESGADYVGGKPDNVGSGYWGTAIAMAMGSRFGVGAHFRTSNKACDVDTVAFGAFRKSTFLKVGPFDEDLVYSEDNEYTHRVRDRGGRVYFDPAIHCTYHTRKSLPDLFRQYHNYGWGRMRHALRDGGGLSARHLVPMLFVGALIVFYLDSPVFRFARHALGVLVAAYLVGGALMTARLALSAGWRYIPAFPLVFGTLHFSYGIGQWHAVASHFLGRDREARRKA